MVATERFILPHDQDQEGAVIGCLLLKNELFYKIEDLTHEHFFFPVLADMFKIISENIRDGLKVDRLTFQPFFEKHPDLPENYLADLVGSVVYSAAVNFESYVQSVISLHKRRQVLIALENASLALYDISSNVDEVQSSVIGALQGQLKSNHAKSKIEVAGEAVKAMELPRNCYPTGLFSLDQKMGGGLYSGFTYALCGQEKRGKTTFANTISYNLNETGCKHAYFALEMGAQQIEERNLARMMGVNSMEFLKRDKDPDLVRRMKSRITTMRNCTTYLDMPSASFDQIKTELHKLAGKGEISGFILDYWQLITCDDPRINKAEFLGDVAQWVAGFARKNKLWCIMLAQLNRENNVFASGGLDKACDQMYFIEKVENVYSGLPDLWLNMRRSRYTPTQDIGSAENPVFAVNYKVGPHITEGPVR